MKRALPVLLAALLGLTACRGVKPMPTALAHRLEMKVEPASPALLPQGTIVRLSAAVQPPVEMAWVSGTVKIFGAKVLALKQDPADGQWKFKTMVPYGISVPGGRYELKAWGRTSSGEPVEGSLIYEVK